MPPSARYWLMKATASEICGAEAIVPLELYVGSQSIISGIPAPTRLKAYDAWPAPLPACRK